MSAWTARAAVSSWALAAVLAGCAPGDDPAAPPAVPDPVAARDHASGARVQLSPVGYVAYARAGDDARPFVFTARLSDSAGTAIAVPAAGLSWAVRPGRAFRLKAAGVAKDRTVATAQVKPMAGGRDVIVARHGSASDTAFAENWQWLPAAFDWDGDRWTPAGESRCVRVALQAGSIAASLANFELYVGSFDPTTLRVDSAYVAEGGQSLRLCMTARSSGTTAVALVGQDTTSHQYLGWHREHAVLESPLALSFEHGDAYEIGVGQRAESGASLSDRRGTSVLLDGAQGVSWTSADTMVAVVDAAGTIAGRASGSVRVSAEYRGLTTQASVEVYEITGGRVGEEVVCVSTRRGTVRCWGNSKKALLGYGVASRDLGIVRPRDVADVPVGARVQDFLQASLLAGCAITVRSDLRCWGDPNWGALGYGNGETRYVVGDDEYPRAAGPVPLGGTPAYVGGGYADHFCVVLTSGGLRCMGSNLAGQPGYGIPWSAQERLGDDETPAELGDVPLGGRAVDVATGGRAGMTCAALANGRGRCWGINADDWVPETATVETPNYGLGYGRSAGWDSPIGDDETPADVGDLPLDGRIAKFALGGYHICALMEGGTVRCWGTDYNGQLGNGQGEYHIDHAGESIELRFPSPVVQIEAGWLHTCVLMESGAVRCWGANSRGALGLGDTRDRGLDESAEFVEDVSLGGPAAKLLGSGSYENCAIMRAGGLRCWGANWNGHFGYPSRDNVGDDELPAAAGDIQVFPGPVPRGRLGSRASRASARTEPSRPLAEAGPAHLAAPSTIVLSGRTAGLRWLGPLAGADGVVVPEAVPTSAVWVPVAGVGR